MYSLLSRIHEMLDKCDYDYIPTYYENSLFTRLDAILRNIPIGDIIIATNTPILNLPESAMMYFVNNKILINDYKSLSLEYYLEHVQMSGLGLIDLIRINMFTESSEQRALKIIRDLQSNNIHYKAYKTIYQRTRIYPFIMHNDKFIPIVYYIPNNISHSTIHDIMIDPLGILNSICLLYTKLEDSEQEDIYLQKLNKMIPNPVHISHSIHTESGKDLFGKVYNNYTTSSIESFTKTKTTSGYIKNIYSDFIRDRNTCFSFYYNSCIDLFSTTSFTRHEKDEIIKYTTRIQKIHHSFWDVNIVLS